MKRSRSFTTALFSILLLACAGCSTIGELGADDEQALLRVTSTDPDNSVVFDATFKGVMALNSRHVVGQQTPFEMRVSADNFRGVFERVGGSGDMQVEVVSSAPAGSDGWFHLTSPTPVTRVVLNSERKMIGSL